MELNKITFTNIILDNLNNSISDNGKVDLDHFINLTNKTYEAINYSRCCKSESEQLCDCKKHSIKTNYGFEVCTKCGNEFND